MSALASDWYARSDMPTAIWNLHKIKYGPSKCTNNWNCLSDEDKPRHKEDIHELHCLTFVSLENMWNRCKELLPIVVSKTLWSEPPAE